MQIPWVGPNCDKYIDNLQILGPNSRGVRWGKWQASVPKTERAWQQRSLKLGEV